MPPKNIFISKATGMEKFGSISNVTGTGSVNLIKDGTGTWTLTQDIGYTGNTTVINGILEVTNFNPATANTSLVDIEAGAQLIADSIIVNTLTLGAEQRLQSGPSVPAPSFHHFDACLCLNRRRFI